jgi:hypothetical protein
MSPSFDVGMTLIKAGAFAVPAGMTALVNWVGFFSDELSCRKGYLIDRSERPAKVDCAMNA